MLLGVKLFLRRLTYSFVWLGEADASVLERVLWAKESQCEENTPEVVFAVPAKIWRCYTLRMQNAEPDRHNACSCLRNTAFITVRAINPLVSVRETSVV